MEPRRWQTRLPASSDQVMSNIHLTAAPERGDVSWPVQSEARGRAAGAPPAWRSWLRRALPVLVIAPPLIIPACYVLGFTAWTTWISFTPSTLLPENDWIGLQNYWSVLSTRNWNTAFYNLLVYSFCFVVTTTGIGFLLAALIDQRIRSENLFRSIFLYPLAVSFVVTGTVWRWLLSPELGIERLVHELGWMGFRFNWITDRDMAIYAIAIAGIWQASGFAMALFLAGIRSVEPELIKAAQIDGARPWRIYLQIVLPSIRPVLVAVLVILLQIAIKTFDLVRALTNGGPGIATTMPATVVYDFMFQRGQLGRGSAAAVLMLLILLAVLAPYFAYRIMQARRERTRG
jgi:glucose/mannose transport system permease protein